MAELKMLPGEANAAANFLRSKLKSQITIRGKEIQIDAEKADEVKFHIKKFLHREGLEGDYRVLSQGGIIRVIPEEKEQPVQKNPDDKVKGVPPFPPLSSERLPLMQTVYPNYGSLGVPPRNKKKRN